MNVIVILGMHRSGTSGLTRALGLLGASLGPPENLGKHWESRVMRRPNEDLLEAFGGGWDCPPQMPEGWVQSAVAQHVEPSARVAFAEFGSPDVLVWKDPRTCTTLPFWLEHFDGPPRIVFVHRHPVEVADSLTTRNELSRAHGFALWERFNHAALQNAAGFPTVAVPYLRLIEEPVATMRTVVDALAGWGVTLPNAPESTDLELTAQRRHHSTGADDVFDDPTATDSQRELFTALRALPVVSDSFAPPAVPPASPLSDEILDLAAQLRFARIQSRQAREELRKLTGSRRRLLHHLMHTATSRPRS
jgi:hypothetical protein